MKIGIIGNKQSILGFRALGLETFGLSEISKVKERIAEFAILFATEDVRQGDIEEFLNKPLPAFLRIPGVKKSQNTDLKDILKRALGSEMINI